MKTKKYLAVTFAVLLAVLSFTFSAFASDVDWSYNATNHTLYITGSGNMQNYDDEYSIPWSDYSNEIENVVIESGVTSIGDYSFSGLKKLAGVNIADTVTSVGINAFAFCPMLNELYFGKNIISIADSSFLYNGLNVKDDFILNADSGTYALSFAFDHSIPVACPSIECGQQNVSIYVTAMNAVYPFKPKYDGIYKFYSSGTIDTKGYLYDSSHKQLAYCDDDQSLSNGNFSITYNLQKDVTYYISASLFSKGLKGSFTLNLEALSFTYAGTVNAMLLPDGTASDIILSDALVNGQPIGESFTIDITGNSQVVDFEYNGMLKSIEITPNSDSAVTFVACDANNDGYVNAKDYAIMTKNASPFLELFENFINYKLD